ncbi:MAG: hypothetical protein ACREOQ_13490 [Gemmatimonadales bacterium]
MSTTFSAPGRLLIAGILAGVSACSGGPGEVNPPDPVASVTVNPAQAQIEARETVHLGATARSESGTGLARTMTWESPDTSIATVTPSGVGFD